MGAKVGVLVLVLVSVEVGLEVAVAEGSKVDVAVGSAVDCVAQPAKRTAVKKIKIRRWNFIIFSKIGKFYLRSKRASPLIARNSVTLKFIPNFREVITGIIKPTGVITGVSVITTSIVEAVLGFAMYVLASVRAIVGMMIDDIVYQASIKNLRENKMLAGFIGIEREGHFIFPENLSSGNALHVMRVERVGIAYEIIVIRFSKQPICDVSLQEVKISLVFIIPGTVKTEIFGKAGKRYIRVCGGERLGRSFGRCGGCGWRLGLAGQRGEGRAECERRCARWVRFSGTAGRERNSCE